MSMHTGGSRSCATGTGRTTHTGGSRSCATETGRTERTRGSASLPCETTAGATSAASLQRRHPSRNSVMTYRDNCSIMLYVTVVTDRRSPILANKSAHDCIVEAWKSATDWLVGRYVVMPDHIHFFCSPATYPPTDFHRWMAYWKSLSAMAYWRMAGGSRSCATGTGRAMHTGGSRSCATEPGRTGRTRGSASLPCEATTDAMNCVPPARNPPLFQRDCWDRQLRTGESYAHKWEYVRNNPVRKGLVANADDWPYQGQINVLEWHERI